MQSKLHGTANELSAPYVAEMVRREMLRALSATRDAKMSTTRRVTSVVHYRSIHETLQQAANYSLRNGLLEFTRRRGFRE